MNTDFDLRRDAFNRLVLTDAQGQEHVSVVAVRAFPIAAPDEGVSVLDVPPTMAGLDPFERDVG